jgi:hypothetical protein
MFKKLTFSKQTAVTSSAISRSEVTFCPLSLWCLQCSWWTVSTANINTVWKPNTYKQFDMPKSQLSRYQRCCFLSPTSWQPFSTNTTNSSLMSLQSCQHRAIKISQSFQYIQNGHLLVTCLYFCLGYIRNAFVATITTVTHNWRYFDLSLLTRLENKNFTKYIHISWF